MKKFLTFAAILTLAFTACKQSTDNALKQAALTIKNESSFVLTDVKFSGVLFSEQDSEDIPVSGSVQREFESNNESGYIISGTFGSSASKNTPVLISF